MSSFARTTTGDLDFSSHTLVINYNVGQCAAWDIQDRFNLALGEWAFDTAQGWPVFTVLGVKNPDLNLVRSLLRSVILSNPTIATVNDIAITLKKTRELDYTWQAVCTNGQVITYPGGGNPFIITDPT